MELDSASLKELERVFRARNPGFVTFPEPGDSYRKQERDYKHELVQAYQEKIAPLLAAGAIPDAQAEQLFIAIGELLTSHKLAHADNHPQNLLNWRGTAHFKAFTSEQRIAGGRAFNTLLTHEPAGPSTTIYNG